MLIYFIDFEGGPLYLLDMNACFFPQIREVINYNLLKYAFWAPLSLGDPNVSDIISFYGITDFLKLPLWSISCFSLLSSASFHSINLSSMSFTLSSA